MTPTLAMALERGADAGLRFLLGKQSEAGMWRDFLLPAGQSDLWVTAYVGCALAAIDHAPARAAAMDAWRGLEAREVQGGGWSYNAAVPGDADSTLWGLRLAAALDTHESPRARAAERFLATHLRADGGLSTYADHQTIGGYVGLHDALPFEGWLQSHGCVTAAGASLAGYAERLCSYLHRAQTGAGSWRSYWWFADEYTTSEAVTAMVAGPMSGEDGEDGACIARAARWAEARIPLLCASPDKRPPAFALALALRVLLLAPQRAPGSGVLRTGIEHLCAWQNERGAWPASARLRVPRPDVLEPHEVEGWRMWRGLPAGPATRQAVLDYTFNNYSLDYECVFTTATVLGTLERARRTL